MPAVSLTRATAALKTSTLIALGAFAVHQLRYLAGYGEGADAALGSQGHAYLVAVLPVLVVLAVSSVLGAFLAIVLSRRPGAPPRGPGWMFCAAALLVVFGVQETAEGLISSGHPGGPAALTGHGGWLAAPIAIVVGRVVSLLLATLDRVERRLIEPALFPARRARAAAGRPRAPRTRPLASEALAFGFARRPPPLSTGPS